MIFIPHENIEVKSTKNNYWYPAKVISVNANILIAKHVGTIGKELPQFIVPIDKINEWVRLPTLTSFEYQIIKELVNNISLDFYSIVKDWMPLSLEERESFITRFQNIFPEDFNIVKLSDIMPCSVAFSWNMCPRKVFIIWSTTNSICWYIKDIKNSLDNEIW